jgi:hypothetical protein
MDDDAPVSTFRAWLMRSNLQHLIDMSPQHRVNWAGTNANNSAFVFFSPDTLTYHYSQVFQHTWIDRRWPCGLDIQISGKTDGGGNMAVTARVVPHVAGAGVFDVVSDAYWEDSGTITLPTSEVVIDSIYYPGTTSPQRHGFRPITIVEGTKAKQVSVCLSRLDITWTTTDSTTFYVEAGPCSNSGITGVSVREFC